MSRRTRIVATLGPATDAPDVLRRVLAAGVAVARINFSHGSGEEPLARISRLRETAASMNRNVAVLADLPGPKLRVRLPGPRELAVGEMVAFAKATEPGDPSELVLRSRNCCTTFEPASAFSSMTAACNSRSPARPVNAWPHA